MAEIVLRDVDKFFGPVHVIRKLDLTVSDREFVVLLGPSGCGKTTTLRAIAGLEEIDSGEILIDGRPVQDLHASGRDIAFVFQLYALYPHLTVYENIAFPLRATGISRDEVDRSVRTVAEAIELDVPAPVITQSLLERLRSRQDNAYADRLLAAMRAGFGGHGVKTG